MNRYPRHTRDVVDLKEAAKAYVLPGFVPQQPVLPRSSQVWATGSCFAENITAELRRQGINTGFTKISETTNSPALLLANVANPTTREVLPAFDLAVITLGVAATEKDGKWTASTVAEVKSQLAEIVSNIRAVNERMGIFFTLSPVPLKRALWHSSAVAADTISKATLRAALSEYLADKPHNVLYWPAYEIVRGLGMHRAGHFGAEDNELRHVSKEVVEVVVGLFIESWFKS